MAKLTDLPREIISLICSLLKQSAKYHCSLVNKEFHDAAIPELWREPILPTTAILKKLLRCLKLSKHQKGDYIRIIKLGHKVSMVDDELLSLMQLMPNLEVLELCKAEELTDKSIKKVSQYCSQLKSFAITGALVTYRSAHALGKCLNLQKLTLASCPKLTPISLLPFVELKIEYLDLSGCKWLNVIDTAYDLASFRYLTHLSLFCCDIINSDFIHHITTLEGEACLTQLQDFSITGGTVLDDDAIIPFIKAHQTIRGLILLECAISDATLDAIGSYLPLLNNLDLSFNRRITSTGVRHLINRCIGLKLLGLKNCAIDRSDFLELSRSTQHTTSSEFSQFDILNYIELAYIREHSERLEEEPIEISEDTEMGEDETVVMDDEDSVVESYHYIQQYLNAEVV